jgi:hypothetical protein
MTKSDATARIAEALDDLDRIDEERKEWIRDWRLRREIIVAGLISFRDDERQMRLGEDTGEPLDISKAVKR